MNIIVTGAAGFIGFHLSYRLLQEGHKVFGIDNINSYYDPLLKESRLEQLRQISSKVFLKEAFQFEKLNLENQEKIHKIFKQFSPDIVINLAAQAGVRYSIENPMAYINSNLVGFGNVLENCRKFKVRQLIYASSSSVYGGNEKMPFTESDSVDHPISLYAATKRANELMAHTYSHLYSLPATGLRFFTVYGPWGRPDMALFLFTKAILEDKPINLFNGGNMIRDFTYVDDIVESIYRLLERPAKEDIFFDKSNPDPSSSWAPHRIFNIGNSNPVQLMDYVRAIEKSLGKKAIKEIKPMQPGDVVATSSDTSKLEDWVQFKPKTPIDVGVNKFINWYKKYYDYDF